MDGSTPNQQNQQQSNANQSQQAQQASPPDPAAIEQALLQKVFGGKYKTPEDAARGYWELNQSAANAAKLLQEQRDNPATVAAQRPNPLKRLADEAYIPMDAFQEAVNQLIEPALEAKLRPFLGAVTAQEKLEREFPAYLTNRVAITGWLEQNPQVAAEVQELTAAGLYTQAAKLATYHWQAANPPKVEGNKEQQQQAALQTGNNVNTNRRVDQSTNQDQLTLAVQYAQRTGDKGPAFARLFPDWEPELPPHLRQQR